MSHFFFDEDHGCQNDLVTRSFNDPCLILDSWALQSYQNVDLHNLTNFNVLGILSSARFYLVLIVANY